MKIGSIPTSYGHCNIEQDDNPLKLFFLKKTLVLDIAGNALELRNTQKQQLFHAISMFTVLYQGFDPSLSV